MTKKRISADRNIDKVIALCNEMIQLADNGADCYLDDHCGVFYSALRDSAYKIRRLARNEQIRHETGTQSS